METNQDLPGTARNEWESKKHLNILNEIGKKSHPSLMGVMNCPYENI